MKIFRSNPFAQYSAEEEKNILEDIFYEPKYYRSLLSILSMNSSRFLLGQRGDGKSVVIYKLFKDLSNNETLPILITRYDEIPLKDNEKHFLCVILRALTIEISKKILTNKKSSRKLSKYQKERLSVYIKLFYSGVFSNEFIDCAKEIKSIKTKNLWKRIYNCYLLAGLNRIINAVVGISSSMIRESLGLPTGNSNFEIEYLKSLEIEDIEVHSIDDLIKISKSNLVEMLNVLSSIAKAIGYPSIVFLFDKIDEFQAINGDVEMITDFCIDILTDTDLLLSENIAIVFSLWSEIRRSLNSRGARFDKFGDIEVRLSSKELIKLLNKRLAYFSANINSPVNFDKLIPNQFDRDKIIEIADRSPRTLIKLLGDIYMQQEDLNLNQFEDLAISTGIISFCKRFDYESINPNRCGGTGNLYSWIDKLLKVKLIKFTVEDINRTYNFSQKSNKANNYVKEYIRLGLVAQTEVFADNDEPIYEVQDPRIRHLIVSGITSLDQ